MTSHPTRLRDIKAILDTSCTFEWKDKSVKIVIPLSVWAQVSIEEIALIVLGREEVKDFAVIRDIANYRVVLELHNGRFDNLPRNSSSNSSNTNPASAS